MEKYGRNHVSSVVLEEIHFFRKKPNPVRGLCIIIHMGVCVCACVYVIIDLVMINISASNVFQYENP